MKQETSSLPLIFTVTSAVALLGLTIFTAIAVYRQLLPRFLRLMLEGVCLVGATGLATFLLCHYGLYTRALTLTLGDQLLLAPHTDADLDSHLLKLFCHCLRVSSDKPGLTVWTAAVSPNRVTGRLYTLLLPVSQQPPTVIPLRLSIGDRLTVKSAPNDIKMAIYAPDWNWSEWEEAGLQQEPHETCCAWWQLRPLKPTISMEIETSGLHHLVLRGPPTAAGSVVGMSINRSIFEASVCDPVVCDAIRVNSCRVDTFERPSILEVRITEGSESDFDILQVWIACEYKGWAVALFASIVSLGGMAIICLVGCCRRHLRFNKARMSSASPVYAYPREQTVGTAYVKHGVDFV
ncbi:hypothetical protein ECG_01528 [Echinococcus granulosus]|uniref:DUF5730 domain-containing protein n=1 Tax=Echinococcus granulosus TaxID=6210 RepID=U6IUQ9_ECHGR|nr:hypothetical protein EGR_00189 [Echinococcus granulosus]EUB64920.1 hypothetical protein EGR_00189 [Echinococcus granulosus]KAH9287238.1 hypothetical protein ECG_01528 [Echinococcus granulosus]CDS15543.1 hypothetical protein EgrG_000794100 [Echinococcus granulosus]